VEECLRELGPWYKSSTLPLPRMESLAVKKLDARPIWSLLGALFLVTIVERPQKMSR